MPWIETTVDPQHADRKIAYEPWMTRWAMWNTCRGKVHVVIEAKDIGLGIATDLACGERGGQVVETATWFRIRKDRPRLCRRCVRALAAAGESGRIEPPVDGDARSG